MAAFLLEYGGGTRFGEGISIRRENSWDNGELKRIEAD